MRTGRAASAGRQRVQPIVNIASAGAPPSRKQRTPTDALDPRFAIEPTWQTRAFVP